MATFRRILSFSLVLAVAGCGGSSAIEESRTAVQGSVTIDGEPLRGGSVTLISVPEPELRITAMIREDGSFSVANAPRGAVKIAVETESLKFGAPAESYVAIPPRYASVETSELTADIQPGGELLTVELHR